MEKTREHKHRLSRELYVGNIVVAFTVCVHGRRNIFSEPGIFSSLEKILLETLNKHECDAHVYLFMPDHCHILIQGNAKNSDLWRCMVSFKQRSGYWLSQNEIQEKWQKDFYDHILRKDEDIIHQVRYILGNPVRENIVADWRNYEFKGSTIYNFDEWLNLAP